ncbi:MAG: Spy/CpxP family protein refolding chaperone [Paludibacterium sp.]|uniref:Spy/CpxP family protein refolding chaperone n=1 Tax=Paludibacterium sp. TaxID=1917523 RepID=UPI0025FC2008|nr:Spy/CpxP family protein refolding chaperone [Paludibacterium sp.]MBV8049422.1 Spy/CpxP family protein refolding chaperone [Paludibacterium sp.]MBV8645789.1 Spy/CpxP family protein refolding chaperone [Paludibacterium sp.]
MKSLPVLSLKRSLQAAALAGLLTMGLGVQAAEPNPAGCPTHAGEMLQRMQQHQQQRLDRLAQALNLQPGQQAAWKAFAATELAAPAPFPCPKPDATPVDMAQARADHARLMADRMAASSKAVADLWQVLSADQRQTLTKMMHHPMMRPHPDRMGDHPDMPPQ